MNVNTVFGSIFVFFLFACSGNGEKEVVQEENPVVPEEKKTAPKTHYGIDISQYNGDVLTEIGPEDSLSFMICKATEGVTYTDPDFATNWKMISAKKLIRGTYHFYHTQDDPIQQAEFFLSVIGNPDSTDIPPILDIEEGSLDKAKKIGAAELQSDLLIFLNHLEKKSGRVPMLYTGEAFANEYLNNPVFAKYPLWLAEYSGTEMPVVPETWKVNSYKIWQKSDSYNIESKPTDFDLFVGELEELYR